jgi:hypothetical protein
MSSPSVKFNVPSGVAEGPTYKIGHLYGSVIGTVVLSSLILFVVTWIVFFTFKPKFVLVKETKDDVESRADPHLCFMFSIALTFCSTLAAMGVYYFANRKK